MLFPRTRVLEQAALRTGEIRSLVTGDVSKGGGAKNPNVMSSVLLKKLTNAELVRRAAQNFDAFNAGVEEEALEVFPALELFARAHKPTPANWLEKWRQSGKKFFNGRIVALKSDPVWQRISQFGLPCPPFDEFDLIGVREVGVRAAIELGLLERGALQTIVRRV